MTFASIIISNDGAIKINENADLQDCKIICTQKCANERFSFEAAESLAEKYKENGASAFDSEYTVIINAEEALDNSVAFDGSHLFARSAEEFEKDLISQLIRLKKALQGFGIFSLTEKDFTSFALSQLLKNLYAVDDKNEFIEYANELTESGFYRLGILGHTEGYFPCKADFKRLISVLKTPAEKFFDIIQNEKAQEKKALPYIDADALPCLISEETSSEPKISVIIPAYNVEEYIGECLDSALNSTLKDLEIICIDDGSTDSTPEILKEYAEKDGRIIVLTKQNGGAASSRNLALPRARGKYIHFLDSDDKIHPRAYEYLYSEAENNNLDILYFDYTAFYHNDEIKKNYKFVKPTAVKQGVYDDVMTGRDMYISAVNNKTFCSSTCFQLVRKEFLTENNISFVEGIVYEDNIFNIQTLLSAKRAAYRNIILYLRRIREGSVVTSTVTKHRIYSLFTVLNKFEEFATAHGFNEDKELYSAYVLHCGRIAGQAYDAVKGLSSAEMRECALSINDKAVYSAYKLFESIVTTRRSLEKAQSVADGYVIENARLRCQSKELQKSNEALKKELQGKKEAQKPKRKGFKNPFSAK